MTSYPVYAYRRSVDQDSAATRHPVIVVGAGPVGLTAAIDLAQHGIPVVVLDDDSTVSVGSRAICHAKRTLEIFDRLGCGEALMQKGVRWSVGKVFHRDRLVYRFDLLPEQGHRRPAFINLQQYHLEACLVERLEALRPGAIRWMNRVSAVAQDGERVIVSIVTPDGEYALSCDWLIAADGARSPLRAMLGIEFEGRVFHDHFLIVDVRMSSALPIERTFWFDPPFHPNQSALMHRQADDVWRIDFQLGRDADAEEEKRPERILPRLHAMLGDDAQFEIEWASVYTFQCRRMQRFRHGRIVFAGDAAHVVSPFGARGANGGVQDVDNLVWKLALVVKGDAPATLIDSYDAERTAAADENIRCSTRTTDFITPKSPVARTFRDATLALARHHAFARRLVNSGRLSVPAVLASSPLNTSSGEPFDGAMVPGASALDAPVEGRDIAWFLECLGTVFTLVVFAERPLQSDADALARDRIGCRVVCVGERSPMAGEDVLCIADGKRLLAARYDARPGTCYLFRPDQHVCARWRRFDLALVRAAIAQATANA